MSDRSSLRATIDRLERDEQGRALAVLVFDDGQQLVVPAELLPPGAGPQQVVDVSLQVNPEETARRGGDVERLQRELFGD